MDTNDTILAEPGSDAALEAVLAYIQTMNETNRDYSTTLQKVLALARGTNMAEENLEAQVKIGKIKQKIQEM